VAFSAWAHSRRQQDKSDKIACRSLSSSADDRSADDEHIYVPADVALRLNHKREQLLDALRSNHSSEMQRRNAKRTLFLEEWPPLVLVPTTGGASNAIVLEYDLFVFSPLIYVASRRDQNALVAPVCR